MNSTDVSQIIYDHLEVEYGLKKGELDETTLLFSEGHLDSFNMVELVTWIEKKTGVRFGVLDINLENLDSIERISQFVAAKNA